jgi:hypothetical protein
MTTSEFGPLEHVYVENEWYDGPRAGIANLGGKPHRFVSQFDDDEDDVGTFLLWPADQAELVLEQEQWQIFVRWNAEYEAGRATTKSHPGAPGNNSRWDEINSLLKSHRETIPSSAQRARVKVVHLEHERYAESGPAYQLAWKLL